MLQRLPSLRRRPRVSKLAAYARVVDQRTMRSLGVISVVSVASSVLEIIALAGTMPLLQLLAGAGLADAGLPGQIVEHFIGEYSRRTQTLVVLCAVVGLLLIKVVVSAIVRWWTIDVVTSGAKTATTNLFAAYLRAPLEFHTHRNSAKASRTATWSVTAVFSTGLLGVATAVAELGLIVLIAALIVVVSPLTALAAVVYFGVAGVAFNRLFQRNTLEWARQRDEVEGRSLTLLQQALGALREIRLRGDEPDYVDGFADLRRQQRVLERKVLFSGGFGRYYVEGAFFVGFGIVATVQLLTLGDNAVAGLGVMLAAGFRLLPSAGRLLFAISGMREGEGSLSFVLQELDAMGVERLEPPPGRDTAAAARRTPAAPATVEVVDVSFQYPGASRPAVEGLNVTVAPGQSLGIVGSSGSGKTTTVDLVCGLLQPTSGVVRIDGTPVATGTSGPRIGYVPQDVFLLDSTVARNIIFSDEQPDERQLARAVQLAQLEAWVGSLPEGLRSNVGERGALVSGGQRQRIGIARALYRDPSILILDEATSALDVETEANLTAAISALGKAITLIVIAHRLSTVRGCDRILLLSEGRMVGLATYDELSREDETFARWVDLTGA